MTLEQLERDVAELKVQVAALQVRFPPPAGNADMMAARGLLKDQPGFADVIAFGRYFRITGQLPPDDWNPGDPIPEPEVEA
jgi:hypothetical protein